MAASSLRRLFSWNDERHDLIIFLLGGFNDIASDHLIFKTCNSKELYLAIEMSDDGGKIHEYLQTVLCFIYNYLKISIVPPYIQRLDIENLCKLRCSFAHVFCNIPIELEERTCCHVVHYLLKDKDKYNEKLCENCSLFRLFHIYLSRHSDFMIEQIYDLGISIMGKDILLRKLGEGPYVNPLRRPLMENNQCVSLQEIRVCVKILYEFREDKDFRPHCAADSLLIDKIFGEKLNCSIVEVPCFDKKLDLINYFKSKEFGDLVCKCKSLFVCVSTHGSYNNINLLGNENISYQELFDTLCDACPKIEDCTAIIQACQGEIAPDVDIVRDSNLWAGDNFSPALKLSCPFTILVPQLPLCKTFAKPDGSFIYQALKKVFFTMPHIQHCHRYSHVYEEAMKIMNDEYKVRVLYDGAQSKDCAVRGRVVNFY